MSEPEVQEVRLTKATILVLGQLLARTAGKPAWGFEICRSTELDPGTVYPILTRLRNRGWVSVEEEGRSHPGRPARRFYRFTSAGRQKAVQALGDRQSRMVRNGIR